MKVSVWDTYVRTNDGFTKHFDILVPEDFNEESKVFEYGRMYLKSRGIYDANLDSSECRECHIEDAGEDVISSIDTKGFHIIEMDNIPDELPVNPTRSQMILHLRANYPEYRFQEFRDMSDNEVLALIMKP